MSWSDRLVRLLRLYVKSVVHSLPSFGALCLNNTCDVRPMLSPMRSEPLARGQQFAPCSVGGIVWRIGAVVRVGAERL